MIKPTIEEINGRKCTVIRKPFDAEWVKEQLDMGIPIIGEDLCGDRFRIIENCYGSDKWIKAYDEDNSTYDSMTYDQFNYIITTLPALPRYPKPEDAPLLYRYMAEGIVPVLVDKSGYNGGFIGFCAISNTQTLLVKHSDGQPITIHMEAEITHATMDGERVEIAIEEKDND
jgi:hypothetical protein